MVETANDRSFMIADFGETVTFTPTVGPVATLKAIYDNVYEAVEAGGSVPYAMSQPRLTCRTADIPSVAEGDAFTIRSSEYYVTIVMADGTGITELALEAQDGPC